MTGIAVTIVPGGSTYHHKLCLPICDTNDIPKTLKPENVIDMQRKMNSNKLAMAIIDEISSHGRIHSDATRNCALVRFNHQQICSREGCQQRFQRG